MRGEILTYDDGPGAGLISGDDGARYTFTRADLQQLTPVRAGLAVDFIPADGVATKVILTAQPGDYAQSAYGTPGGYTPGVAGSGGGSLNWKTLFLDPNGRIGQKDYWIGFGILFAVNVVLGWTHIVPLISIYFGVCVASKRLHDFGKSGWLAGIPFGIIGVAIVLTMFSVFGGVLAAIAGDNGLTMIGGMGLISLLWPVAALVNIGFVIWLGVTAGDQGDNAYGPPPTPLANF